ncbi:MAG: molybdate ABC transporter substrate-binding protein [Bacteroidota bacterium]
MILPLLMTFIMIFSQGPQPQDEIRVAVASNFSIAMTAVAKRYEAMSGHKVILMFGSTGKHYAQIRNGAALDAFFSADAERPTLLERDHIAVPGSRFTYAVGKIILWSPKKDYVDSEGRVLAERKFRHLAIANPKLAPYGKAAQQVLQARGLWDALGKRLVRGEDVGQTFQFVRSGSAELGFIALSQVKRPGRAVAGSWWDVPQSLYSPIEQQAVLLNKRDAARGFMAFVRSEEARKIIRNYGYETP